MNKSFLLLLFVCSAFLANAQVPLPDESLYGIAFWSPDSLGNHRAVVHVTDKTKAVRAVLPWRRHDKDAERKSILIQDAATGQLLADVYATEVNREQGTIVFRPETVPGDYYIYYLPYHSSGGPYPRVNYQVNVPQPSPDWLGEVQKGNPAQWPAARLRQFQSRGAFNSFYPMEIIATSDECRKLYEANAGKDFLVFPEDRAHPIKMYHDLPYRWIVRGPGNTFAAEADQNEYFVFQLGIKALDKDVNNIRIHFKDLQGAQSSIPASAFTCFNTSGRNWDQQPMTIAYNVPHTEIRPLWIGVQMPTGVKAGRYQGMLTVSADGMQPQDIRLDIQLSDRLLTDKGDSDMHRLSRLRWLNSDLACNDEIVRPFTPLSVTDQTVACLGRDVTLDKSGLPTSINSYFTEVMTDIGTTATPVLQSPMRFIIEQNKQPLAWENESFRFLRQEKGIAGWESRNRAGNIDITCRASMEFDGFMEYTLTLKARETTPLSDIRLNIPLNAEVAEYWLGMGHTGGKIPAKYNWKWNVEKNQEGFWIGTVNAGLHCVFRDEHYSRPLNTNFYHSKPLIIPECWNNGGKGGIRFATKGGTMLVEAYSGARTLQKDQELTFIFRATVTPFKPIDTEKQWHDRYLHSYEPIDNVVAQGANTINIHHGTPINPHINYPFFRPDFMKAYIDEAHAKGCKVKIYYTVRELANRAPELWALRSLGHEIFSAGQGNGYSWLQEHLEEDYIAAWFVEKYTDAAIVNSGVSRWHNFYVEGLNWLVKNVGIDGLYIDDLAFDRTTMKRIRKVLDAGCPAPRIDLHSANQFNPKDGFINSACLYMEHMPYLDRLWLGEYFDYNAGPDYWLTEVSGIPYGMMGEMLQDCGNPWRGMIYGMTSRLHWDGCEVAQHLWKAWDDFGIRGSRMIGYWVSNAPVQTNNKDVLATCYVRDGKTMIAIASWAKKDQKIKLKIDWQQLGIDPTHARLHGPAIPLFQSAVNFDPNQSFLVEKGKGYLLILE